MLFWYKFCLIIVQKRIRAFASRIRPPAVPGCVFQPQTPSPPLFFSLRRPCLCGSVCLSTLSRSIPRQSTLHFLITYWTFCSISRPACSVGGREYYQRLVNVKSVWLKGVRIKTSQLLLKTWSKRPNSIVKADNGRKDSHKKRTLRHFALT